MRRGVRRTEGIRPSRASRRTVDSLTCRTVASWRAVRNSSRDSSVLWCESFKVFRTRRDYFDAGLCITETRKMAAPSISTSCVPACIPSAFAVTRYFARAGGSRKANMP